MKIIKNEALKQLDVGFQCIFFHYFVKFIWFKRFTQPIIHATGHY